MQFLVSVIAGEDAAATLEEQAAIDVFNDRLQADRQWVFAGGLSDPATATVFDNRAGAGLAVDGPFVESKEHFVGFWVIDAPDLETARRLAAEGSQACNRKVELRQFLGE